MKSIRLAKQKAQILGWVANGMNLSSTQRNPFSFNKEGFLKYDKNLYKKLSKQQKAIGGHLTSLIDGLNRVITIKTVQGTDLVPAYGMIEGPKEWKENNDGDMVYKSTPHYGQLTANDSPGFEGNNELIINGDVGYQKLLIGEELECGDNLISPTFVIFWHELGHLYYGGYLPNVEKEACKAVDLENMVRNINHLPWRNYIKANHNY